MNIKSTYTSHYLTSLVEFMHIHMDKSKIVALAFVDFREVFDLIGHAVVMNKAICLGTFQPDSVVG